MGPHGQRRTEDDLVKRLRDLADCAVDVAPYETMLQAANRIEALEKDVEEWKKWCVSVFVEFVMLGSSSAEKTNVKAIFKNAEELLMKDKEDD